LALIGIEWPFVEVEAKYNTVEIGAS